MSTDNFIGKGDHPSVGEELLDGIPQFEQKCFVVHKAVTEGYFSFREALRNYKVSEIEFYIYVLLKNNASLMKDPTQDQFFEAIDAIMRIYDTSRFDSNARKFIDQIKSGIDQNKPSGKNLLEKELINF